MSLLHASPKGKAFPPSPKKGDQQFNLRALFLPGKKPWVKIKKEVLLLLIATG